MILTRFLTLNEEMPERLTVPTPEAPGVNVYAGVINCFMFFPYPKINALMID